MTKQKNYTFVLTDVNLEKVYSKYGLVESEFFTGEIPVQSTMIEELNNHKSSTNISFVDESKTLCHAIAYSPNLNSTGKLSCFWCRNNIPKGIKPLGCPVRYVPHQIIDSYYSEISKDNYVIKENIPVDIMNRLLSLHVSPCQKKEEKKNNIILFENGYYILEGGFCSFNCCVAFIDENSEECLYKHSYTLLLQLYEDLFKEEIQEILPAPHWKKLIEYGGDLNIESFREGFNKIIYVYHGTNVSVPKSVSIKHVFEERIRF